jgi:serine/threonine-protein kinase
MRPSRNVAVKVLLPGASQDSTIDQEFLARFRREADVIARLEHVNIVPIYEYGEQDGLAYLVMPYLSGGSLRDVLRQRGRLSLAEAATYIDQAAAALDYAHAHGVIHRDLKPANFLFAADGRLVLADFGIARIMDSSADGKTLTSTGMVIGTPEYMAPEMASGERVDYRADIYELGVILFQMLSGQLPFAGTTPLVMVMKQIQEPLPLLHHMNPAIPSAVDAVIQKATAKRREDRYTSVREMAQAFRAAIAQPASPGVNLPHEGPTARAAASTVVSPAPVPAYNTPPAQPRPYPNTVPTRQPGAGIDPSTGGYIPPGLSYETQAPKRPQSLLPLVAILLALVLIIGGVLVGLLLGKGSPRTNPTPPTPASTLQPSTPAQATPSVGVTATPSPQPTPTPTLAATPTPTASSSVPSGTLLYTTSTPGQNCDTGGGQWRDYNGAVIVCQKTSTRISNSSHQYLNLVGTFLIGIPGHPYPSNYVVHAQMQQVRNSSSDFGIYFRNQPGSQPGVYTFMIHPDGTWSSYVYDNVNGNPVEIAKGSFGDAHARVTLDIVVNGSQFTFYANGQQIGSAHDATYSAGTAGIALDAGGTIVVSQFTLSAL